MQNGSVLASYNLKPTQQNDYAIANHTYELKSAVKSMKICHVMWALC